MTLKLYYPTAAAYVFYTRSCMVIVLNNMGGYKMARKNLLDGRFCSAFFYLHKTIIFLGVV